jgi:hypothetical protein
MPKVAGSAYNPGALGVSPDIENTLTQVSTSFGPPSISMSLETLARIRSTSIGVA